MAGESTGPVPLPWAWSPLCGSEQSTGLDWAGLGRRLGVIGREAFDLWREKGLWGCTGQKDYAVPCVAYSQTLSLPPELLPLMPSCPRVLSFWGAKGAVVVGDNRAPADQSEDVRGELMQLMQPGPRAVGAPRSHTDRR